MPPPVLVVTAADARYFDLLRGAVRSVRDQPPGRDVALAVLDLGLTPEQRAWAAVWADEVCPPGDHFDGPAVAAAPPYLRGLLARPYLRDAFPGHEVYLWLDADAWVQDWAAVDLFVRGAAARRGLAVVPELDRGSRQQYGGLPRAWATARAWYEQAFGPAVAAELCSYPLLNAGVFALHRDAPHWAAWADALGSAARRACTLMTDQVALNYAVYRLGLFDRTELLPAWCNWACHHAPPAWDPAAGRLVEPYLPHAPIGVVHLTREKRERAEVAVTTGGRRAVSLRYEPAAGPAVDPGPPPPGDYVSPGLAAVLPDRAFPHLARGDPRACVWPYLRRDVPHPWYVDRRAPGVGFVSRDEAAVLLATARRFRGQPALEIGCWLGWSACHLALGGVRLDVVDPVLARPEVLASVRASLGAAGVAGRVNLVAAPSPEAIGTLAADGRRWSLFFVDGDHAAPAPERDAEVCARYAADDALVLFHDLACPDVARGLDRLRAAGWHTAVYQTMQLMGAAWRGAAAPVPHTPDPAVRWDLPGHLTGHPVVGPLPVPREVQETE